MDRVFLSWLLVFFLLLLIQPSATLSATVAGHVIAAGPGAKAKSAIGKVRTLKRRSEVYQGDTILTGKGSVQIRFSDGSLTALRPRTTFKIINYQWSGKQDGSERGFFSLLKGGLRTISGAIGKLHRKNYRMQTPSATIGIRGTSYFLELLKNMQLKGGVTSGKVYVWNQAGGRLFKKGDKFFVKSGKFKPILSFLRKQAGKGSQSPGDFGADGGFVPPIKTDSLTQPSYSTNGSGPQSTFGGYTIYTPTN